MAHRVLGDDVRPAGRRGGHQRGRDRPQVPAPREPDGAGRGALRLLQGVQLLLALWPPVHRRAQDVEEPQELHHHPRGARDLLGAPAPLPLPPPKVPPADGVLAKQHGRRRRPRAPLWRLRGGARGAAARGGHGGRRRAAGGAAPVGRSGAAPQRRPRRQARGGARGAARLHRHAERGQAARAADPRGQLVHGRGAAAAARRDAPARRRPLLQARDGRVRGRDGAGRCRGSRLG
mmetsp:Transcript_48570/g.157003  ORF Transcript_48570/g.157003 Transcript_48570/m.157003 type:complete len:234 (-) Transcript_48570:269-970(-)